MAPKQKPPENGNDKPKRMTLANVVKGQIDQPLRLILYGPSGIGKSTFGSHAPVPIFLGAEKGTAQLDVARLPQPRTWAEVFEAITALGTEDHTYKTLVVDTLDWIEPLCHRHVCEAENARKPDKKPFTDIDEFGYGRGYNIALDQWRKFLAMVERLHAARGMNIVLLAHSQIKKFANPEADDYDRYEMKLHHKASGLLQEWADEVLFANYDTAVHEDNRGRVRGIDSGSRIIHTTRRAAWDAKNRHSLPATLPLSWEDYEAAVKANKPADHNELTRAIDELIAEITDNDLRSKVLAAVKNAGNDSTKLANVLNRLKALTNKEAA